MVPLALSVVLCLWLSACYLLRPDGAAAVTVFPVWVWPLPGLLLAGLGWRRPRWALTVGGLWGVYVLALAGEPASMLRGLRPLPPTPEAGLRVVSLNCAGGSELAAAEVKPYRPTVVLLQETPSRPAVERLARQLYGSHAGVVWSGDAALLGPPETAPLALPPEVDFAVAARVPLPSGADLVAVSLRLTPPLVRVDLWNPACWREQAANRRHRRQQVELLNRTLTRWTDTPLVVGGDFNAPAGDGALWPLRGLLREAFRAGGRGWGNTHLSDLPLWRIDQLWLSPHWRVRAVTAQATVHSDHRVVVGDLDPRPAPGP